MAVCAIVWGVANRCSPKRGCLARLLLTKLRCPDDIRTSTVPNLIHVSRQNARRNETALHRRDAQNVSGRSEPLYILAGGDFDPEKKRENRSSGSGFLPKIDALTGWKRCGFMP